MYNLRSRTVNKFGNNKVTEIDETIKVCKKNTKKTIKSKSSNDTQYVVLDKGDEIRQNLIDQLSPTKLENKYRYRSAAQTTSFLCNKHYIDILTQMTQQHNYLLSKDDKTANMATMFYLTNFWIMDVIENKIKPVPEKFINTTRLKFTEFKQNYYKNTINKELFTLLIKSIHDLEAKILEHDIYKLTLKPFSDYLV